MNMYKAVIEVYFASAPNEEHEVLCDILDGMNNVNTNIKSIEDTGEGVPIGDRIVDECPDGDWTCPYFIPNGCTLESCREECDAWAWYRKERRYTK